MKLRKITLKDTEKIVRWRNDTDVLRYFLNQTPLTLEKHNEYYRKMIEPGKVYQFIIVLDDGREIGTTYLKNIDKEKSEAELGLFIGERTEKGKGYGTEAARKTCDFAFSELGLHKVYLRLISNNERAKRCYIKAGFTMENVVGAQTYSEYGEVLFMSVYADQK